MLSVSEKAFLGSLMKADYLLKDTVIQPEQLESSLHKDIMRTMVELNEKGKNIDLISLTTVPNLESLGGMSYLSELLAHADIEKFDNIESLILDQWKEREKRNILTLATMNDWEIDRVISELDNISQVKMEDHTTIQQALTNIYEAPWEDQRTEKSPPAGINKLDQMTGGFQKGEVTVLAARPSMGKTDMMLHFAKMAGWDGYLPIIFSLEMPERLITKRLIASTGGYNRAKMRNPNKMLTETQKNSWSS
ncbi:MAG: DnaB-like helicase C-terminal domain-containing protein, partial [Bacillus sp. (in: firmicutes)]